jgi:hypothetical protein
MLKNESARNQTKPVSLRPSRLPESGGIIFIANGVRMRKISPSVRKAKQTNFGDADCTCPYSPYRHVSPYVSCPYSDTWHAVQLTWQIGDATRGRPYSADVSVRTGHVAASVQDTWQTVRKDTWRHQDAPRVTRIWHFQGTDRPIKR